MNLTENDLILIRLAIKEGLEQITKLESRLYPQALEVDKIRGAFYALEQKFQRVAVRLPLNDHLCGRYCQRLEFHI